jgi:hypothetical protein
LRIGSRPFGAFEEELSFQSFCQFFVPLKMETQIGLWGPRLSGRKKHLIGLLFVLKEIPFWRRKA